jgi:hypothetical protein
MPDDSNSRIGLAEFLHGLRTEIEKAVAESAQSKVRFRPGAIDLELQVQAERKGGAGAGVEFKIFGTGAHLDADGSLTAGRHQTLKMRLEIVLDPEIDPNDDHLMSGRSDRPPR